MHQPDNAYPPAASSFPQPGFGGAYPPSPPYAAGGPQPTVVVAPAVTTTVIMPSFADTPASCTCPACHQKIVTRIVYNTGLLTWLLFGILLLLGCWLGCCLIPFFVDGCKDVDHFCPNCNNHLSKYKRL